MDIYIVINIVDVILLVVKLFVPFVDVIMLEELVKRKMVRGNMFIGPVHTE